MIENESHRNEFWSIVANIKKELPFGEGGLETRKGTRQFKGGAKVHIVGSYPGMCDSLIVIGQNKHTGKFIRSVVRVTAVENFRIKLIYGEAALGLCEKSAPRGAAMISTKEDAEHLLELIPEWCQL